MPPVMADDDSWAPADGRCAAELDAAYAAYDALAPDVADDWGDLASFRTAAGGPS